MGNLKKMSKKDALPIILQSAKLYHENLVNRSILFVCRDKHGKISSLEVTFDKSNFLHLTGVSTPLSASAFYERCIDHRLAFGEFEIPDDGTMELKLEVLPSLMTANLNARMVGGYNGADLKLQTGKLAGGVTGCMGFIKPNDRYIPNTVLNEDIRKKVSSPLRILATYRKFRNEKKYTELVYKAKKIDWSKIQYPKEFAYIPVPNV